MKGLSVKISRLTVFMMMLMLLALATGVTPAQTDAPDAASYPTASQMLAHRLTMLARRTLVSTDQAQPQPARLTQSRILLEQANALDGSDPERWLLTAEAQSLCDDRDAQIDALKQYMRLAPTDDAAQLRLIDLLTAKMQTADLRLAYLLKIVEGPSADRFSAPLRSRVALRAAILAAELGQPDQYGRLLTMALQLDSTNKQAAAESLRVLSASEKSTAQERAAAMLTLFQADPADGRAHAAIGRMLMSMAQYADAADWFAGAARIDSANRRTGSISLLHEWALALWGAGRGSDAISLLAQLDPPAPKGGGDSSPPPPAPEADAKSDKPQPPANPDWPPLDSLMLRVAILANNGTSADLAVAFKRLDERLDAEFRRGQLIAPAPGIATGPAAARVWAQLLCDQNTDQTAALLDKLATQPDSANLQLPLMRGWLAMRTGQLDIATQLLTPLADADPRAALGLAMAELKQPDAKDQAIRHLRQVVLRSPTDIFGMTAASQLRRMSLPLLAPADAQQVAAVFAAVPVSLRQMAADPMRFVQVRLVCSSVRYDFGQPITATLEIRNVNTYPLSMGPDGSIPTRLFLSPSVSVDLRPVPPLSPMVMDVSRRLRIEPLRSLSIPVRLDSADLGLLLTDAPWSRIQIGELAILNPTVTSGGAFVPGMLGSTAFLRDLVRRNVAITQQAVQQKISELGSSDPAAAMRAMAMLVAVLSQPAEEIHFPRPHDDIARAMVAAFPGYSPVQQAYLVSLIPPNDIVVKQLADVLSAAAQANHPLVQLTMLATQVHKVDDPILNAGLRGGDMTINAFAAATRTVLETQPPEKSGNSSE
ncbi:MAG: tetratricopeptide repeat protein [Phycisphaerales bacterium]